MDVLAAVKSNGERTELSRKAIEEFMKDFDGDLVFSDNSRYNEYRAIWNGMIDRKPCFIVRCKSTEDVVRAVKFAHKNNILVSVRSGGHHVSGRSICDDGMVIDLSEMRSVDVDPKSAVVRVQGGAKLGDVDAATAPFGLVVPLGAVSATGVAGLTLHGGYGWLARKYGLSLDNLQAAEVITPEGKIVRASEKENPDLFWALRGGGGNFGIVTSFEFKAHPIDSQVWFLMTFYPVSKAREAIRFLRDYMPKAPDELGLIGLFWNAPNEDFIPAEYRGEPVFIFVGCYSGPQEKGEEVLAPFRHMGEPLADLTGLMPFKDIQQALDKEYPDGRHYYWKSAYIDQLDDDTIDTLIDLAAKRPSPLTSLDIWPLGGKIKGVDANSTAFYQRNAPYLIGIESNWDDPANSEKNVAWSREVYRAMNEKHNIGTYMNFPGFGEEGTDMMTKSYGPNYKRLKEIKAKYDPDNFFKGFISI